MPMGLYNIDWSPEYRLELFFQMRCNKRFGICRIEAHIDIALLSCLITGKGAEQTNFRHAVLFGKTFLVVSQEL